MPFTCFLSYAREDSAEAQRVYDALTAVGAAVWFDRVSLRPGERWETAIRRAIRDSRYFLALLSSRSVVKQGFVQRELREAIAVLEEFPDDQIYLIPVRLDDCAPTHGRLNDLNWVDLFPDWESGISALSKFLVPERRAASGLVQPEGIYQSDFVGTGADRYRKYLRFYRDGTVLDVTSTGSAEQIESWFIPGDEDIGGGRYEIDGFAIRFTTRSSYGEIDFEGTIEDSRLILNWFSHINGNRGVTEYQLAE